MDERWAVELHWDNGKKGGRTHVITVSNQTAAWKIIKNIDMVLDEVLDEDDVLEFEESDYDLV